MIQAVDNLRCFVDILTERNTLYMTAMDSLLRAAFVGAVQALWVLLPGHRFVRQYRTVLTWADDWDHKAKVIELAGVWFGEEGAELAAESVGRNDGNRAAAKAWMNTVREAGHVDDEVKAYTVAGMIPDVSAAVFRGTTKFDERLRTVGLSVTWKRLSSAIHATPSSALSRLDLSSLSEPLDGTRTGNVSASPTILISDASAIAMVLSEAWRLYDLRSIAPR